MKWLLGTKHYIGVISVGRLILYREAKPPSHEKIVDQVIQLQGPNITIKIKSDHKHEKRFTLVVKTKSFGNKKEEIFEVGRYNIYNLK